MEDAEDVYHGLPGNVHGAPIQLQQQEQAAADGQGEQLDGGDGDGDVMDGWNKNEL